MNTLMNAMLLVAALTLLPHALAEQEFAKTRLVIMADMGNEPDEEQQMVHMLMYSNMFDLEGLIAVSGKYLHSKRKKRNKVRPDLFEKLISNYAKVLGNLKKHAKGWPEVEYLRSINKPGTSLYGISGIGPGKESPGSKLLMKALVKNDPRPVYVVGNAGTNTLAQALRDLDETKSDAEMDAICSKIIVYENGAQDDSGVWIMLRYPKINWHRSNHQTYGYGGPGGSGKKLGPHTWEPHPRTPDGQNDWAKENIMTGHGPLGAVFPPRRMGKRLHFIEGGGTSPWIGLANHGLFDPQHMHWGGWGGRFSKRRYSNKDKENKLIWSRHQDVSKSEKSQAAGKEFAIYLADTQVETWTDPVHNEEFTGFYVPVWRFRRAMFNDFRARMDWCVKSFSEANHNPVAAVNGDKSDNIIVRQAKPGETVKMDASGSTDPDSDKLNFSWWVYNEAGAYKGDLGFKSAEKTIEFKIPADAKGKQIHLILEVTDQNKEVSLYDYRRVVFNVK